MPNETEWRVGRKIALNVYEGERPVCQCHNEIDASRITNAMMAIQDPVRAAAPELYDALQELMRWATPIRSDYIQGAGGDEAFTSHQNACIAANAALAKARGDADAK